MAQLIGDWLTEMSKHNRPVNLAAETVGDLMVFWGFRRSMGVVWTVLYLHNRPMSQDDIVSTTGLSMGSVSTTLSDLERWGVVHRHLVPRERRRFYIAETNVHTMITSVLRQRELRKVRAALRYLESAARELDEQPSDEESEQIARRLTKLVQLGHIGEAMLEHLTGQGSEVLGRLPDLDD